MGIKCWNSGLKALGLRIIVEANQGDEKDMVKLKFDQIWC
jgi:hypothetical protein